MYRQLGMTLPWAGPGPDPMAPDTQAQPIAVQMSKALAVAKQGKIPGVVGLPPVTGGVKLNGSGSLEDLVKNPIFLIGAGLVLVLLLRKR